MVSLVSLIIVSYQDERHVIQALDLLFRRIEVFTITCVFISLVFWSKPIVYLKVCPWSDFSCGLSAKWFQGLIAASVVITICLLEYIMRQNDTVLYNNHVLYKMCMQRLLCYSGFTFATWKQYVTNWENLKCKIKYLFVYYHVRQKWWGERQVLPCDSWMSFLT